MNCCKNPGYDQFFTDKVARRDARRYRRKGLDGTARKIVQRLGRSIHGKTVLEVGGGIGAIQLELLAAGAARTTNVELSSAYEPFATELAYERDLDGQLERRIGDFVAQADELESADVVVLNRVVCCYPDHQALIGAAADHARRQLVLSFPRDVWWMRLGLRTVNLVQRLRRQTFRVYLHKPDAIVGVAVQHGLSTTSRERGIVWELALFQRS